VWGVASVRPGLEIINIVMAQVFVVSLFIFKGTQKLQTLRP